MSELGDISSVVGLAFVCKIFELVTALQVE